MGILRLRKILDTKAWLFVGLLESNQYNDNTK